MKHNFDIRNEQHTTTLMVEQAELCISSNPNNHVVKTDRNYVPTLRSKGRAQEECATVICE